MDVLNQVRRLFGDVFIEKGGVVDVSLLESKVEVRIPSTNSLMLIEASLGSDHLQLTADVRESPCNHWKPLGTLPLPLDAEGAVSASDLVGFVCTARTYYDNELSLELPPLPVDFTIHDTLHLKGKVSVLETKLDALIEAVRLYSPGVVLPPELEKDPPF